MFSWNEFTFALLLTYTEAARTMPVLMPQLMTEWQILWGPIMAAGFFLLIPALIFSLIAQRYIIHGLTLGAVKA